MHVSSREGRIVFKPLNEPTIQWCLNLTRTQQAKTYTEAGVVGFGRTSADANVVSILVGPNTDLGNKDIFPDEIEGQRIIYESLPLLEV